MVVLLLERAGARRPGRVDEEAPGSKVSRRRDCTFPCGSTQFSGHAVSVTSVLGYDERLRFRHLHQRTLCEGDRMSLKRLCRSIGAEVQRERIAWMS
jgi:hypothetical protein